MRTIKKILNWQLKDMIDGTVIPAHVPGDITADMYQAGLIEDPNYGMNHKQLSWITDRDFTYTGKFVITEEDYSYENIALVAKGIDTFADIYINGTHLCYTENMFLEYRPDMKHLVHVGENTIQVHMHSTTQKMSEINTDGYFGIFNIPRLFIRKSQCQFGWDWAPNMCAYGIWEDLYVSCEHRHRIDYVNYEAYINGDVTLFAELNYCTVPTIDYYGKCIEGTAEPAKGDKLLYTVLDCHGKILDQAEGKVTGYRNFINLHIDQPALWWPAGYGEQPLYTYSVVLIRDGKQVSQKTGTFAFREVELVQKPISQDAIGFTFYINGREVHCRGSNWVPADCFTGTITEDKYDRLVKLAKNANMNMLRVWGGGIYEKEAFYNACDREGIMVWQDFMFSCADIPENDPAWTDLTTKECIYQIKRLRTHPSIVYWCGGNEKVGSYIRQISKGDNFVNYILHGVVAHHDRTRPYGKQSPTSFTDVGCDVTSGDGHVSSLETALHNGTVKYREHMANVVAGFYSECATLGPCSMESFCRFLPEDKLWPTNEVWDAHMTENPYAAKVIPFAERQKIYIAELYREPKSLQDFVAKGGLMYAEMLRAEIDYARFQRPRCSGFMNWMYNDIWPNATWSVVDYYCEPKQGYYAQKKAYAPRYCSFAQNKDGQDVLFVLNDTHQKAHCRVTYGAKNLSGEILWSREYEADLKDNSIVYLPTEKPIPASYLFVNGTIADTPVHTLYSKDFWRSFCFESDYTYQIRSISDVCVEVTVKAKKFVKSLFISLPENEKYLYSDNYVDIEAGEEISIFITAENVIDCEQITVTDYAKLIS